MEDRAIKLQHYDFSGRGWKNRGGRSPWERRSSSRRRKAMLFRYGAAAALVLALLGFKKFAGSQAPSLQAGPGGSQAASVGVPGFGSPGSGEDPAGAPTLSTPGLDLHSPFHRYPSPDTFTVAGHSLVADYAADSLVQARIGVYLHRYRPDAAVVLACDLKTGRMLGVGERRDSLVTGVPRMAFLSGFPAASLIKILTATAAIELKGKGPADSIPQIGSYHTLYRRQLRAAAEDRGPKVTLQEAFSKSVNPAFGILGLDMGGGALQKIAADMGFNRPLACINPSIFQAPDTGYSLAETACGFTARTTISPLHALAIARGIGDDGRVRYGAFARSLTDLTGRKEIQLRHDTGTAFVSAANLPKLQALMAGTVRSGTARKGFHQVMRASHMEKIEVGGKTGSLDGLEPKGRYDWFIGYVRSKEDPSRGMALSIMLVHGQYANVRSTVLAALLIRDWLAALEKARKLEAAPPTAVTGEAAPPSPRELAAAGGS